MLSGIYCIENLVNGKKYIGQSSNLSRRLSERHSQCVALLDAFSHYGKENFNSYIVIYCEIWELDRLEIECIKIFHSCVSKNGYNISLGGSCPTRGLSFSDEYKHKLSLGKTGEKHPHFGKKDLDASSKYFGVYRKKNCWVAQFKKERRSIHIGSFNNEIDAAKAYDEYVLKNNFFHPLNFPQ